MPRQPPLTDRATKLAWLRARARRWQGMPAQWWEVLEGPWYYTLLSLADEAQATGVYATATFKQDVAFSLFRHIQRLRQQRRQSQRRQV